MRAGVDIREGEPGP